MTETQETLESGGANAQFNMRKKIGNPRIAALFGSGTNQVEQVSVAHHCATCPTTL